jgi:two-component system response regulator RegX3
LNAGRPRVLVVEDEPSIADRVLAALSRQGFQARSAATGEGGISEFVQWRPDVVLLDLMLPDVDGREVCRRIRAASDVPIIVVSARSDPIDRVVGLELGADDYLVKPFSTAELAARIRAVLRRAEEPIPATPIEVGDIRIEPATRTVTKAGSARVLTAREFDLLLMLMRNAGRVVLREVVIEALWGADMFGSTKTLDVHIARLRAKLEDDPAAPRYITTVRGVGYRFAANADLVAR